MNIQNNFSQQYHPIVGSRKSNFRANVQSNFQRNFDNYYNSLNDPNAGNVSNPMPNAPQSVKDAWAKAEQEIGKESLGVEPDGRLSRMPAYVMARLEQRFQTGSGDMFGSSVDSALAGAQKILDRLNNPLSPPSSANVAALQEKEKLFYQRFIDNLANIQSTPRTKEVSPATIYEKMTGRSISADAPSYNLAE